jgi:hypothetical protein
MVHSWKEIQTLQMVCGLLQKERERNPSTDATTVKLFFLDEWFKIFYNSYLHI